MISQLQRRRMLPSLLCMAGSNLLAVFKCISKLEKDILLNNDKLFPLLILGSLYLKLNFGSRLCFLDVSVVILSGIS